MPFHRPIPALLACLPLLLLASCVTVSENPPKQPPMKHTREAAVPAGSIAVSPLTRIGFDKSGVAAIFLHLAVYDSAGAPIKSYGQLHVELYQPGVQPPDSAASAAQSPQTISSTWDADLRDPVQNTLTYDELITHTYTVNLTGIPEWLVHWARHEGDMATAAAPIIVAQFQPKDGAALRATYTLTR